MKIKLLLALCFFGFGAQAQNVSIPDTKLKMWLVDGTGVDSNGNTISIDANNDNEIQASEAQAIWELSILINYQYEFDFIASLQGLEAFTNLRKLTIQGAVAAAADFSMFTHLEELNCSYFTTAPNFDLSGLTNLHKFYANHNYELEDIDFTGTENITELYINSCDLSGIFNINNMPNLEVLEINYNAITGLNLTGTTNIKKLSCTENNIITLDVSTQTQLEELNCSHNNLVTFNITNQTLTKLDCSYNSLNALTIADLPALKEFYLNGYMGAVLTLTNLPSLEIIETENTDFVSNDFSSFTALKKLTCSYSNLTSLTLNNPLLESVDCSESPLQSIDISECPSVTTINADFCTGLNYINLKNGSNTNFLFNYVSIPTGAGVRKQICLDEGEMDYLISINNWDQSFIDDRLRYDPFCSNGKLIDSTATTIIGGITLDINNDGCDIEDILFPDLKVNISNGSMNNNYVGSTEYFTFVVPEGTYTITPDLGEWFTATPASATVTVNDLTQYYYEEYFCVTANGVHPDLDIIIMANPEGENWYDKSFKLIYKNKGNQTLSGTLAITFDDSNMVYAGTGQPGVTVTGGLLEIEYTDLPPFTEMEKIINFYTYEDLPATITATIYPVDGDETPEDNTADELTTVSTGKPNKQLPVTLYPNPATDAVTLTANNTTLEQVTLFDMQGRQLQTATPGTESYTIDVSGRAQGVYLVKILTPKGAGVKKIIKN
jgi:Secretion system C-terminal sorting domain